MANLKNITDLPVAESAEGLNLIVNDGGSAKQIATSAVLGKEVKAYIDVTYDRDTQTSSYTLSGATFEEIVNVYSNGDLPKITLRIFDAILQCIEVDGSYIDICLFVAFYSTLNGEIKLNINSDNTVTEWAPA